MLGIEDHQIAIVKGCWGGESEIIRWEIMCSVEREEGRGVEDMGERGERLNDDSKAKQPTGPVAERRGVVGCRGSQREKKRNPLGQGDSR